MAVAVAANVGKVVQVIGPVVDIEFEGGLLPSIYNAVRITGQPRSGADGARRASDEQATETIDIVVTVPTFRRPDQILVTLDSLRAQETKRRFAVIVIENEAEQREDAVVLLRQILNVDAEEQEVDDLDGGVAETVDRQVFRELADLLKQSALRVSGT